MPAEANTQGWLQAGEWFAYRGLPVFFHKDGHGTPPVCLDGFPTASWDWHRIWPSLIDHFTVVAPDMLGFGFSAKPRKHPYSILGQGDLAEALLRHVGLGHAEVHLRAHDSGDTVAQELRARQTTDPSAGFRALIHSECVCRTAASAGSG